MKIKKEDITNMAAYCIEALDLEQQIQNLDRICKEAARGFLLTALAGADAPAELIQKVLSAFRSDCDSLTFYDAASISKQITDPSLLRQGIKEAERS